MSRLVPEIRLAARRLFLRSRGFAIVSVATLAVGIGSTSAIFSAVNPVLLRPLPFPEPDRLLGLGWLSQVESAAVESGTTAFDSIAASRRLRVRGSSLDGDKETEVLYVAGNYFGLLGARPQLGRLFSESEKDVAVLSDELWRTRYSRDPSVIGKTIELPRALAQIVGVAEPMSLIFPTERVQGTEVWTPFARADAALSGTRNLYVVARLAPESTLENAQTQLDTVSARLATGSAASTSSAKLRAVSLREVAVRELRPLLTAAFFVGLAVLLIGLGNLTNLQIARNQQKAREFAIRTANGASQWDLLRLGLAESLVLCSLGGIVGLILAALSRGAMVALLPRGPYTDNIRLDGAVVAFSLALSIAAVLVLTLLPRVRPTLHSLWPAQSGHSGDPRGRRLIRQAIVGAELGLALSAAFVSGLFLNSFWRLTSAELGFEPAGLAVLHLQRLQDVYRNPESQTQFLALQVATLGALPGVTAVGVTSFLPLSGESGTGNVVTFDRPSAASEFRAGYRSTSGGYFGALGVTFASGEAYSDTANEGEPIAVVNEALARHLQVSPQSLLGQRLKLGRRDTQAPWRRIVGVVRNLRETYRDDSAQPEVFVPIGQDFQFGRATLVARSSRPTEALLADMRSQIDERLLARGGSRGTSMEDLLRSQLSPQRSRLQLLGSVALVACSLALIGIYSVVSHEASRRTKELGIRVALGASPFRVARFVVQSEALVSVLVGLLIGPVLALLVSRQLGGLLYRVPSYDLATLAGAVVLMCALAGFASLMPALRASQADPAAALRSE